MSDKEKQSTSQTHQAEVTQQKKAPPPALTVQDLAIQMRKLIEVVNANSTAQQNTFETLNVIIQALERPQISENQIESISKLINTEFFYDPDNGITFEKWFAKYKDLFMEDAKNLDEKQKIRILMRKLQSKEHALYESHICPKSPQDLTFNENIQKLTLRFGLKETVFQSRFKCLHVSKTPFEDFFTYAGRINRLVTKIDFKKMTEDQFKCLLYVSGLQSSDDSKLREKLLNQLEMEKLADNIECTASTSSSTTIPRNCLLTIDQLVLESERLASAKIDSKTVEGSKSIHKISTYHSRDENSNQPQQTEKISSTKEFPDQPSRPCWNCGDLHWVSDCPFKSHSCKKCHKTGHKDGYCNNEYIKNGKSNGKFSNTKYSNAIYKSNIITPNKNRKYISVIINGTPTNLQFDTASDITIISERTWKYIGCPKLLRTSEKIISASDNIINAKGKFRSKIKLNGKIIQSSIIVSTKNELNIFGNDLISQFGLWDIPLSSIITERTFTNNSMKKK